MQKDFKDSVSKREAVEAVTKQWQKVCSNKNKQLFFSVILNIIWLIGLFFK